MSSTIPKESGARGGAALGAATLGTGAAVTAAVATACCVGPALGPIFVGILGAGGLAAAVGLRPYAPYLLLISGALLAFGLRQVYFARPACAIDGARLPVSPTLRIARGILGVASALWLVSSAYSLYGLLHE